jgi:hypothetical protein
VDARIPTDARKQTLLRAIERALFEAISDSPEVHRSLWRLQRAGYTLRLALECGEATGDGAATAADAGSEQKAAFRIDGEDLRFLRSVGIDPTRGGRQRRRR